MATNKNQSIPSELSLNTRSIRLYSDDDRELIQLHDTARKLNRKIDIVDLIRDCVQAGLPLIQERWEPMIKKEKEVK